MGIYSYVETGWDLDDTCILIVKAETKDKAEKIFKDRWKDSYVKECVSEVIFDEDEVAIII